MNKQMISIQDKMECQSRILGLNMDKQKINNKSTKTLITLKT